MKQLQLLTFFTIILILSSNQVQSSNAKAKIQTKTNIKTNAKTNAKEENYSEGISYDNLNIPGFSSKTIGNILTEAKLKEMKGESKDTIENLISEKIPLNSINAEEEITNMIETNENTNKPYIKEGNVELQNWFSIRSKDFGNNKKFPEVDTEDGAFSIDYKNKDFLRKNPLFKKGSGIPDKYSFYFRLSKYYLWYTISKQNINVVGRIKIGLIRFLRYSKNGKEHCFIPTEKTGNKWTVCSTNKAEVYKFFCLILKYAGLSKNDRCDPKSYQGEMGAKFVVQTVTQPLIIIPTATHTCNAGWSYAKKGSDWECLCKDGLQQSPIDLPPVNKAIESDARPVFEYEQVDIKMTNDYAPAGIGAGDNNVIRYQQEALRIKHPNFGKIVTLDGAVYMAQEIVFHTPSEHTINGVKFDMEMQIIHSGKSVGDTLKTVILSFLFKAKPGSFNKFIDKLEFFDLPNPINKAKELSKPLFIPQILQDSNDEDVSFMTPFSFFTYQGSLTAPPCAEKTIHYVASKPIELSNTTLEMFKESLRIPDKMDASGNVHSSNAVLDNSRTTQPLNGRPIFHYDHKNSCPSFTKSKQGGNNNRGHYERRDKTATQYFFVDGDKPSGIPNAFVVTNKEALENDPNLS
jgi:carbonic anhydrase